MSAVTGSNYDIAIVGAGPVGSLCALVHGRKGYRVALLEASAKPTKRMAGEWLHPPAVRILKDIGIELDQQPRSTLGRGFVVLPEDDSDLIVLPYSDGVYSLACDHNLIVSGLRDAIENQPEIDFISPARVRSIEGKRVFFSREGKMGSVLADRIIGADGRSSVVRRSLGLPIKSRPANYSRMLGITAENANLPVEGYGHLLCRGPGPIFMYRLGENYIRIIVDIPMHCWTASDQVGYLSEISVHYLPEMLRSAFIESLQAGRIHGAVNSLSPRTSYGNSDRVLIGDAAGYYHPLTAVGMTLGFWDAVVLAESDNFNEFVSKRFHQVQTPELLAMEIYEVFAGQGIEVASVRQALYRSWRRSPSFRNRTMRLLACEEVSIAEMSAVGAMVLFRAVGSAVPKSLNRLAWIRVRDIVHALAVRIRWLISGVRQLNKVKKNREGIGSEKVWDAFSRAFSTSVSLSTGNSGVTRSKKSSLAKMSVALRRASSQLSSLQRQDGAWEGEMTWCPMLTAQYVLLHYILGRSLTPVRRRHVLHSFEQTRLSDGSWGMHDHSTPHLFVTTLVYVAARLLGVERDDPLIQSAQRFLQTENVVEIPTWGKFWLALLNLYEWQGVNAMLPELWSLPRRIPLHPANWYCHTRLIYMAMAVVYSYRFQVPVTPAIISLREELFPEGFDHIDFSKARNRLRMEDLYAPPSVILQVGYRFARIFEQFHSKRLRSQCRERLIGRIQWELQTTSHTSISPVSGFLNILALWLNDPDDADARKALGKLDGWIWEDEKLGARITGARSSSWDTAFSLQALVTVRELDGTESAIRRGINFLNKQQIGTTFDGFEEAYRTNPQGGWCFPGGWHGWPVSDCTAEAVIGILAADPSAMSEQSVDDAIQFILRRQNPDGGFGSYEPRRSSFGLEWLNPAEMFGDSMTENSYVECTASCLSALAVCKTHFPQIASKEIEKAMSAGDIWLRRTQKNDGTWRGVWGIQFIYGTLFGIRGLIAAGATPSDSRILTACRWLVERQREDGGWGEHHSGSLSGQYVPHDESQIIQTAWALIALLGAEDAHWAAIVRGAQYLINSQNEDGT